MGRFSNNSIWNRMLAYRYGTSAVVVTPSDVADLANEGALYIGGTGNVKIDTIDGTTVTYNAVPAGTLLPVVAKKVYNTGTTATNIVVNY